MSFNMLGYKLPDLLLGPTLHVMELRIIKEMLLWVRFLFGWLSLTFSLSLSHMHFQ